MEASTDRPLEQGDSCSRHRSRMESKSFGAKSSASGAFTEAEEVEAGAARVAFSEVFFCFLRCFFGWGFKMFEELKI